MPIHSCVSSRPLLLLLIAARLLPLLLLLARGAAMDSQHRRRDAARLTLILLLLLHCTSLGRREESQLPIVAMPIARPAAHHQALTMRR